MDLGATVCVRTHAALRACPVARDCVALREGLIDALPSPRPRKVAAAAKHRHARSRACGRAIARKAPGARHLGRAVVLSRSVHRRRHCRDVCTTFRRAHRAAQQLPDVKHGFTHFNLTITPQRLEVRELQPRAAELGYQWLTLVRSLKLRLFPRRSNE